MQDVWYETPKGVEAHVLRITAFKALPFSGTHHASPYFSSSSCSRPAQNTSLAWQGWPGVSRFDSTETS